MKKTICGMAVAMLTTTQAMANSGWDQITVALTEADGSVDVAIAAPPDNGALEDLMSLMILSTAEQIRIGVAPGMQGRAKTVERVETFISERGLPWSVCQSWWDGPDAGTFGQRVRDDFGGSLVLIDNGSSSVANDGGNVDLDEALKVDPAFAGIAGGEPRMVRTAESYFYAVETFRTRIDPERELDPEWMKEHGGWVDGC